MSSLRTIFFRRRASSYPCGSGASSSRRPFDCALRSCARSGRPRPRRVPEAMKSAAILPRRSRTPAGHGSLGSGAPARIRAMADFLLDSDVVIWHLRGHAAIVKLVLGLARRGHFGLSAVARAEVLLG